MAPKASIAHQKEGMFVPEMGSEGRWLVHPQAAWLNPGAWAACFHTNTSWYAFTVDKCTGRARRRHSWVRKGPGAGDVGGDEKNISADKI